jgi:bifunctional ADP-heptose synthase (sugar kinase/adenylyltransferase)
MGAIGQDGFGFELERALSQRHIDYHLLVASRKIQTFTYTKIINAQTGVEDRPRLDFINTTPLPEDVEDQLIAFFHREYANFDVILVADQAETRQGGVITNAFREVIVDVAERNPDKIMLADSRYRIERFRNTIAKPNVMEANAASHNLFGAVDYARLRTALGKKPLVITQGPKGVLLVTEDGEKHIPAVPVANPVDVCGAGDSFAAGMALALQATGDVEKAAHFGSLVSSITIMKKGTGTASPSEVIEKAESLRASA